MSMIFDDDALLKLAAENIAERVCYDENIMALVDAKVSERVDAVFKSRAEQSIEMAIDSAINGALDKEYSRVDGFGVAKGSPTTIRKELEKLASDYWSTRVDRSGKPTDSGYNSTTRAQHVMAEICAKDFTDQMKQAAVSVTAAMKDGFRKELGASVDKLLDDLFKVKSLADQGKATKPW